MLVGLDRRRDTVWVVNSGHDALEVGVGWKIDNEKRAWSIARRHSPELLAAHATSLHGAHPSSVRSLLTQMCTDPERSVIDQSFEIGSRLDADAQDVGDVHFDPTPKVAHRVPTRQLDDDRVRHEPDLEPHAWQSYHTANRRHRATHIGSPSRRLHPLGYGTDALAHPLGNVRPHPPQRVSEHVQHCGAYVWDVEEAGLFGNRSWS